MRSVRTSSGTTSATTCRTRSPLFASISSNISACSSVRGNPSRMNPPAQSLGRSIQANVGVVFKGVRWS
eukprot:13068-Pelagococcus_subviridis.AAC.1